MTIDRVQAVAVRYPEPNNDGRIRSLCLVRVDTSDGLTGWGELAAIRDKRIVAINDDLIYRAGPRLFDGLERLAELLRSDR